MSANPKPTKVSTEVELDKILIKAFNAYYDYITEKDIIKVAHEYSEKTAYKQAHSAITQLIDKAVVSARIDDVKVDRSCVPRILFSRQWAMPSKDTFTIKPIAQLLQRYVGNGKNWIDPFAGDNSPAEFTNDHNPTKPTTYHLEAFEFAKLMTGEYDGVLFDPPYSFTQVKKHYQVLGVPVTKGSTSMAFYSKIKDEMCLKIKDGGYAISFGWNTNGFGKARGFKIIEIMAVAHGGHRNDTIVTVEQKYQTQEVLL